MKTLSTLSRYLLKTVVVLGLVAVAGMVGVGVAALFAFHELGGNPAPVRSSRSKTLAAYENPPRLISISRLSMWRGQKVSMDVDASLAANRFVAAGSSDKPHFMFADNREQDTDILAPARGARSTSLPTATTHVPPPLVESADEMPPAATSSPVHLTDPGSRFIRDARTGRIVGVDGTAGAVAEAREIRRQAVAATSRPREVRAALPADAMETSDLPPPRPDMYPAIRRALPAEPVQAGSVESVRAGSFDVSSEIADDRYALRAQPVTISQPTRSQRRMFTLP